MHNEDLAVRTQAVRAALNKLAVDDLIIVGSDAWLLVRESFADGVNYDAHFTTPLFCGGTFECSAHLLALQLASEGITPEQILVLRNPQPADWQPSAGCQTAPVMGAGCE